MKKKSGFDMKGMNTKVRPQDDFFEYANGGWIQENPIPDNESRWGVFNTLQLKTDRQLKKILDEAAKKKRVGRGSPAQMVRDFYLSGTDMKRRTLLGTTPIAPLREKTSAVSSVAELASLFGDFERAGMTTPFSAVAEKDLKNSSRYILYLSQSGLGMPDRDYYLKDDTATKRIRKHYATLIERLFILGGYAKAEARKKRDVVMAIETKLARASMNKVDQRDPHKIYNKLTLSALKKNYPHIAWKEYFSRMKTPAFSTLVVEQVSFLKTVDRMIKVVPLAEWKIYSEWHLFNGAGAYLSHQFVKTRFEFYGKILTGNKTMKPLWRRILFAVDGSIGEILGKVYVEKYFSAEAKKEMNSLIDNVFGTYAERILALDWMSPETKKKALHKLNAMGRKIGYPNVWRSYKSLTINKNDYFGNVVRAQEFEHRRNMKKIGKPVDRREWYMHPHEVNAYYDPTANEIVFPAGILQKPFFALGRDEALNYGGIGEVIGHEITHGFDDQGSKFDKNGNLKSWWTKQDKTQFEKKAKILEKQFDRFTVAPNVHVNGKLTLGENIADLGGLLIAYYAYQKRLEQTGKKKILGLHPEQRFFLAIARNWRGHARKEHLRVMVKVDPHSPAQFRVNGPNSNAEEFYNAFGVKKGDKLYRPPSQRAKIW